jgi:hypothetical protein
MNAQHKLAERAELEGFWTTCQRSHILLAKVHRGSSLTPYLCALFVGTDGT